MFRSLLFRSLFGGVLAAAACAAIAGPNDLLPALDQLGHRWAAINYQMPEDAREQAFDKLLDTSKALVQSYPQRAEPLVWEAIVLASDAGAEGGLGALSKVKQARKALLAAEKIDPKAMDGSIYSTLGSLYAKVPGWPLGYGDKKQAATYFHKALAIDPANIDANYFYADLLNDQGHYAEAAAHLQKVLAAPPRPGREDADAGRRRQAVQMLQALKEKHGDQLARQ